MSALGQKQAFRSATVMSALPPKADMCGAISDVRHGPIADILEFGSRQKKNPGTLPRQLFTTVAVTKR
jgi:hypothetical protein